MLKGTGGNSDDTVTLAMKDSGNQTTQKVLFKNGGLTNSKWKTYSTPLSAFSTINLANVKEISLIFSSSVLSGNKVHVCIDEITANNEKRYLDADFDGDGIVGISDMASLAAGWLTRETTGMPLSTPNLDLVPDGTIDFHDVAVFAGQWLNEKKPALWYDAQYYIYEEWHLLEALQGLVNRDRPRLFLIGRAGIQHRIRNGLIFIHKEMVFNSDPTSLV